MILHKERQSSAHSSLVSSTPWWGFVVTYPTSERNKSQSGKVRRRRPFFSLIRLSATHPKAQNELWIAIEPT